MTPIELNAEKEADLMEISREEFFASIEKSEEQYRQGKTHRIEMQMS